jgi:hypothetical protein
MGTRREVWIGGLHKHLGYRKRFPLRGIKSEVYPRKGGIHVFQTQFTIQEHGEKINPRDELLLAHTLEILQF